MEVEQKLLLLQKALARFDFADLRACHRELRGQSDARIVLTDSGNSLPGITINGRPIDMKPFP